MIATSGELADAEGALRYTHDSWGRLVKVQFVEDPGGSETVTAVAAYAYNASARGAVKFPRRFPGQ